jgi:short-subunit dehydrogenase
MFVAKVTDIKTQEISLLIANAGTGYKFETIDADE